jgi:hypothetical protein
MKDLTNPIWIKLKGILFLRIGVVAAVMVYLENPKCQTAALLALAM